MRARLAESFSYQTPKIVTVVDRKIGMIYCALCLLILSYVFFYVLVYKEQYYTRENTTGGTSITPYGTFIARSNTTANNVTIIEEKVFDIGDIVRGLEESNGIFIATMVSITQSQK